VVEDNKSIPKIYFGFRQRSSTEKHIHQTVQRLNETLRNKKYPTPASLDMLELPTIYGILHFLWKIILSHVLNYFLVLKSYFHNRFFLVENETVSSQCGLT
jgi:hypothetical protein